MASPKTTTVQNSTPWNHSDLSGLYAAANNAYAGTPKTAYSGELYAGPTADQHAGIAAITGAAPGLSTGSPELRQLALDQISGKYLDPAHNPTFNAAVTSAIDPVYQTLTRKALPGIADQSITSGAYGGDRQHVAQGVALGDFSRNAMDLTGDLAFKNYTNERGIQQGSGGLLNQANQLALAPGQAMLDAGGQEQKWAQGADDAGLAAWNNQLNAPWNGINQLAAALGVGSGATNQTQTQKTPQNPMDYVQAAAAIAAMFI